MFEKYDAYKDSSVEWIGKIPSHWEIKKNKYLFDEVNIRSENGAEELLSVSQYTGVSLKKDKVEENGLLTNAESLEGYKVVKTGNLVINIMLAWNGSLGVSQYNGIVSPAYDVFSLKDYCSQYFHYLLRTEIYKAEYKRKSKGVVESRLRLYSDSFFSITGIVPPLLEQKQIAKFLDQKNLEIDQAIAIKQQQIALLNERKQIVIQKAVTQGLNPNVPMKVSGVEWIGQIPAHWALEKVKRLFKLIIDPAPNNNDLELLSVYTGIGVRPRKELEERGNKASTTDGYWKVIKGDIIVNKLLAWMGAIGLSNYDGVTSPAYDILRAIKPLNPYFYHLLFRSPVCSEELKKHSRGIMEMRLRLYFDKFGEVWVPFAPINEQNEIIQYIEIEEQRINSGIELIQQQIEKLKEYKTTLINDAVTGKIKVA